MDELAKIREGLVGFVTRLEPELADVKKAKLPDALKFWYALRSEYELLDDARKELGKMLEDLNRNTLPEMFDEADTTTTTLLIDDARKVRFTKSQRVNCSMTDKEGGKKWLRDEGHGDIIQETVNASTLSAFAKSYIEDTGKDLPGELFKLTTMNLISATKA